VRSLCSPGNRNMGRQPKPGPGHKSPHAGAGRQPPGPWGPTESRPGSRGGLTTSWGGSNRPPVAEYGTRVPSLYLLTLAEGERQEETARARDLQQRADAADADTRCQL